MYQSQLWLRPQTGCPHIYKYIQICLYICTFMCIAVYLWISACAEISVPTIVYVYIHMYIHKYTYTCVYICIFTHTHAHTHKHTHTHAHNQTHISFKYVYIRIYAYIHAHAHTHTNTHAYTCKCRTHMLDMYNAHAFYACVRMYALVFVHMHPFWKTLCTLFSICACVFWFVCVCYKNILLPWGAYYAGARYLVRSAFENKPDKCRISFGKHMYTWCLVGSLLEKRPDKPTRNYHPIVRDCSTAFVLQRTAIMYITYTHSCKQCEQCTP